MMGSSEARFGFEIAWVIIVLVIFAFGLVFVYPAFSDLNSDIQGDLSMSNESKAASETVVGNYASNMDNTFFFFFVGLWIFLIIMAFFANTHPVFLVFTFILIVLALIVGMILSNAYQEAIEDGDVSAFANEFPKMTWIVEHLLTVFFFVGFSVMMVLYARGRG